ncbi:hypothetical protein LINPERPRIM_LOCUS27330 [Linum perenne]
MLRNRSQKKKKERNRSQTTPCDSQWPSPRLHPSFITALSLLYGSFRKIELLVYQFFCN